MLRAALVLAVLPLGENYVRPVFDCRTLPFRFRTAASWIEAYPVPAPPGPARVDLEQGGPPKSILLSANERNQLQLCLKYHYGRDNVSSPYEVDITGRAAPGGSLPVARPRQTTVYRALEGQKVQLDCSAKGHPRPTLNWEGSAEFSGLKGVSGRVSGVISSVKLADDGYYTCQAGNEAGWIEQRVHLVVVGSAPSTPPVIHRPAKAELWVQEGEDIELTCSATGEPTPRLAWSGPSEFSALRGVPGSVSALLVNVSQDTSSGIYTCRAANQAGVTTARLQLRVYPQHGCFPLPGFPGSSPPPKPPGCPPGAPLPPSGPRECRRGPPGGPPYIPLGCDPGYGAYGGPVRPPTGAIDDSGLAFRLPGSARQQIRRPTGPPVSGRSYKPPSITFNHPSVHWVLEGKDVELICTAEGQPPPSVSWTDPSQFWHVTPALPPHSRPIPGLTSGQTTGILNNVLPENSGFYRCSAENSAGTALAWVDLRVYPPSCLPGPPGPPGSLPSPRRPSCPPLPPGPRRPPCPLPGPPGSPRPPHCYGGPPSLPSPRPRCEPGRPGGPTVCGPPTPGPFTST